MSDAVLKVEGLCTQFDTQDGIAKAVDDVSFTLNRGEIIGLVGESGSGKSVTGFSLLGLVSPPGEIASGSIELNGQQLVGLPQEELRRIRGSVISMVFQDPMMTLNPVLKIGTQMVLAIRAHKKSLNKAQARKRAIEYLNRVGIPDAQSRLDAYPHEFSGGMRQRVAIAIAMIHEPDIIVADEPTTALDVSIQAQILHEMRIMAKESDTALIWISHDLATVSSLAERLMVMYAGKIVEEGKTADVLRKPRHPYTKGLLDSLPGMAKPGEELNQIPGSTPSLLSLPEGCPFSERCNYSDGLCSSEVPLVRDGDRAYRCHHPIGEKS